MSRTIEIPWLCDRHSHVSVYAALGGCPNLANLGEDAARARLRALPADRVTTVMGWHSSRLKLGPADLAALPPALLINFSMHGFALTDAARPLLAVEQPELVAKVDDLDWCERNLDRLLVFYGRSAGLTRTALDGFMAGLEQVGIGAVEDMLLFGGEALEVIRTSPWAGLGMWKRSRTPCCSWPRRKALTSTAPCSPWTVAGWRGTFANSEPPPCIRKSCFPSPWPSPLGRGNFSRPVGIDYRLMSIFQRGLQRTLSRGEWAGVRGKVTGN